MKKNFADCAIWIVSLFVGSIATAQVFIWGGDIAIVVVFALLALTAVSLVFVADKKSAWWLSKLNEKDGQLAKLKEELRQERIEKATNYGRVKHLEKQLDDLTAECNAYRTQRDEAHKREELHKKQARELRGRAEYWRAKYKALTNAETDPDDTEIVITPNPDAGC